MTCIYRDNPASGFASEHTTECAYRDGPDHTPAVAHAYLGHWCGNVCRAHSEYLAKRHKAEVTDEIYIESTDEGAKL